MAEHGSSCDSRSQTMQIRNLVAVAIIVLILAVGAALTARCVQANIGPALGAHDSDLSPPASDLLLIEHSRRHAGVDA